MDMMVKKMKNGKKGDMVKNLMPMMSYEDGHKMEGEHEDDEEEKEKSENH